MFKTLIAFKACIADLQTPNIFGVLLLHSFVTEATANTVLQAIIQHLGYGVTLIDIRTTQVYDRYNCS